MKTRQFSREHDRHGYALLMVMAFTGVSLIILTGALQWSSQSALLTDRNNEYYSAVGAAEAATEKVLSRISADFRSGGEALVFSRTSTYSGSVPSSADDLYWGNYEFSDSQGLLNRTFVRRLAPSSYVLLDSQYAGLRGFAATYRLVSNARSLRKRDLTAGVGQDIQVASIPIFQFAIFYTLDLEINPGPAMTITGRVHSNRNIYTQPQNALIFQSDVTSAGTIIANKKPGDPSQRSPGSITYQAEHDSAVNSLNLPIGTNNTPNAIHAIIEIPPWSEPANSEMGKERFYNKADLVLMVTNVVTTTVTSTTNSGRVTYTTNSFSSTQVLGSSGSGNGFSTRIPSQQLANFVTTGGTFVNARESASVAAIDIDIARLKRWSETNTILRPVLGDRDLDLIYVSDERPHAAGEEPGIRLKNGQDLPSLGLTVATPDPIYVQGNYNAPPSAQGTSDTSRTKPASLVADSITILSTAWNDSNSGRALTSRTAANTTVNAAFLGGITLTSPGVYSGGVENFPRFLENWAGRTFTYNGSMVAMFDSRIARAPWGGGDVYSPPNRNWAFDTNFLDPTKLPPGTPQVLSLIRGRWAAIRAGTTSF